MDGDHSNSFDRSFDSVSRSNSEVSISSFFMFAKLILVRNEETYISVLDQKEGLDVSQAQLTGAILWSSESLYL